MENSVSLLAEPMFNAIRSNHAEHHRFMLFLLQLC